MESLVSYLENQEQITKENIQAYFPLVKRIAYHIKKRLPSTIDINDLLQSGYVGLLEAAKNYSPREDASFSTYAGIRIHGAIIDFLRKNSWGSREAIKCMQRISDAIIAIETRTQKAATAEEIMKELKVTIDEYARICQLANSCSIGNIELNLDVENLLNKVEENPDQLTERMEVKQRLKESISHLSEKEQLVLSLYYVDEMTLCQIGEILSLTEARICQLHAQAIAKIKISFK